MSPPCCRGTSCRARPTQLSRHPTGWAESSSPYQLSSYPCRLSLYPCRLSLYKDTCVEEVLVVSWTPFAASPLRCTCDCCVSRNVPHGKSLSESSAKPTAGFESCGLHSKGGWSTSSIPLDEDGSGDVTLALCSALDPLGGLYSAFGRFLGWRADLLDSRCLAKLWQGKPAFPPASHPAGADTIRRELGYAAGELAAGLEGPPLWNTLGRTAYLSSHLGQPVIVQVARDPIGP